MSKKDAKDKKGAERPVEDIISLEDLAPQDDVSGGSGSVRFGQRAPEKKPTKASRPIKKSVRKSKKK